MNFGTHISTGRRGQMMTLGAVVAGVVLLAGLVYAISVVPSTGDRATVERINANQHNDRVTDYIQAAKETSALRKAVLSWDASAGNWKGTPSGGSHTRLPSSYELSGPTQAVLVDNGYAYNIEIEYETAGGGTNIRRLVYQGTPGANAAVATTTVTLSDDESLVGPSSSETVSSASNYFAPDASSGNTYNSVRVIVIAWQV